MLLAMLRQSVRRLANRCGCDIRRIGPDFMGREHFTDIRTVRHPEPVRSILDVGANIGQAAELFLTEFPQATIHSFEPFPAAFSQLRALYGTHPRMRLHPLAVGEEDGSATLHVNAGSHLNSLLPNAPDAGRFIEPASFQPTAQCKVAVRSLDSFCAEHGLAVVDLLKIDTQGFELGVLRGARQLLARRALKALYLEVNFVPLYQGQPDFHALAGFLRPLGYQFVGFYDPAYSPQHHLMWCDALFIPVD